MIELVINIDNNIAHCLDSSKVELSVKNNDFVQQKVLSMATRDKPDQQDGDVAVSPTQRLAKPPLFAVVLFNDDYTPMEFVVDVLQRFFQLAIDDATEVMLSVHYKGSGVAGVFPRSIAETKAKMVNQYARENGHPLLCQIESQ